MTYRVAHVRRYLADLMQNFGTFDTSESGNIEFNEFKLLWAHLHGDSPAPAPAPVPEPAPQVHTRTHYVCAGSADNFTTFNVILDR